MNENKTPDEDSSSGIGGTAGGGEVPQTRDPVAPTTATNATEPPKPLASSPSTNTHHRQPSFLKKLFGSLCCTGADDIDNDKDEPTALSDLNRNTNNNTRRYQQPLETPTYSHHQQQSTNQHENHQQITQSASQQTSEENATIKNTNSFPTTTDKRILDKPVPPLPEAEVQDEQDIIRRAETSVQSPINDGPDVVEKGTPEQEALELQQNQEPQDQQPQVWLLNPLSKDLEGRKCLVLDLDETLVHSSFKYIPQADFVIPVEIENQFHNVYVIKRPGVDEFMRRVGELFEIVVFTASVSKYGDPLLDQLDIHKVVHHRLFRESCYNHQGNYIKHLSHLGRQLKDVIIIDNSPASYIFHPEHAVPIASWFSDAHDNELLDMIPFLEDLSKPTVTDVSMVLDVNI